MEEKLLHLQNEVAYRVAIIEQLRGQIGQSALDLADARAKAEQQGAYAMRLETELKAALAKNKELEGLLPSTTTEETQT